MTHAEYYKLFHRAKVNLVAFKPVYHCDDELRKMVEMAVEAERNHWYDEVQYRFGFEVADEIRARGNA